MLCMSLRVQSGCKCLINYWGTTAACTSVSETWCSYAIGVLPKDTSIGEGARNQIHTQSTYFIVSNICQKLLHFLVATVTGTAPNNTSGAQQAFWCNSMAVKFHISHQQHKIKPNEDGKWALPPCSTDTASQFVSLQHLEHSKDFSTEVLARHWFSLKDLQGPNAPSRLFSQCIP